MRRFRAVVGFLIAVLAWPLLGGCARTIPPPGSTPESAVIRITGSDTMQPLLLRWAEEYMRTHPETVVHVRGGGTRVGFRGLVDGTLDLAAASRAMRPEEVQELRDRRGATGQSILVGQDALSIYLHPRNRVRNLTLTQLRGILTGDITNWAELGGEDLPIRRVGRQPTSGTYGFIQERVLGGGPEPVDVERLLTTEDVVARVAADPGAIGYGGMAYGWTVLHCSLEGARPSPANVRSGTYPLARYLYLYAATPPAGPLRKFTDWVVSRAGQRIVREAGYIPLWEFDR